MRGNKISKLLSVLCVCLLVSVVAVCAAGCELFAPRVPDSSAGGEITVPENPDGGDFDEEKPQKPSEGESGKPQEPSGGEEQNPDPEKPNPTEPENPSPEEPENPEPEEPPLWAQTYTLPESAGVLARLNEIYGGEEKVFLLQKGKILRMPCPQDGEVMMLNFTFEPIDYAKTVFEDCVAEFNDVFAVINPNYKFGINYAPAAEDFESDCSIRVSKVQSFSRPNTLGTAAHSFYGETICNFSIQLRYDVFDNGSYIMSVFRHELMHLLGAGDAYNNPNATLDTVMQGYSVNGPFTFTNSDVAFLDAMYRNPALGKTDAQMREYCESYSENNTHSYAKLESATYKAVRDGLTAESLAKSVKNAGYAQADTQEALAYLANGLVFDEDFGKTSVGFGELAHAVETEGTVYYAGRFDVESDPTQSKYWHTTQKYGSNMSSSTGISYKDYGRGILFAMPGGTANSTFFMRSGKYVFAFSKEGGFTSLSVLGMSLSRVYKI